MINKKEEKNGFTLIELMVVVAIIAILTAIVLTSLNDAKMKGNDAAVKSNLDTIRSVTELYYSENGNSYLPEGGATFGILSCPIYDVAGTNMFSNNKSIVEATTEAAKRGNGSACYNSRSVWAVAVGLKSKANTSWCVDSGGASRLVSSDPATSITGGVCN